MSHYHWLRDDPIYKDRFIAAKVLAVESFEDELTRRAVHGCVRKKFEKGEPIIDPATGEQYIEREFSDTLAIFLMKAHCPEKYRENIKHEHAGTVTVKRAILDDEE